MHSSAFPSILRLMDYINNASPSILGTLFFIQNQAHSAVRMMEANKTNWSSPPPPPDDIPHKRLVL